MSCVVSGRSGAGLGLAELVTVSARLTTWAGPGWTAGLAGAAGCCGAGAAAGDYSNVAQRTVANIRRLQDNVCGQYVVQSRHVSSSGAAAAVGATCQYEQASGGSY